MIKMFVDFLPCSVYKNAEIGDCTNNGASSRWNSLYLCKDYVTDEDVWEYCKEHNITDEVERFVCVENRVCFGNEYKSIKLVFEARQKVRNMLGGMSGGNLLYTCDGRWKEITGCDYPLSIHDRYETQEQYDALSR